MALDARFLSILTCPVSKLPLRLASKAQLGFLNRQITEGRVQRSNGQPVTEPWTEALVRDDAQVLYRVNDGIPVLLPEEGIGTTQFTDFPK